MSRACISQKSTKKIFKLLQFKLCLDQWIQNYENRTTKEQQLGKLEQFEIKITYNSQKKMWN